MIPETVFHYTAADGLLGILETRHLWVSDIEFLNDVQEVRYGIDIVRAAFEQRRYELENHRDPDDNEALRQWGETQSLLDALESRFPATGGFRNLWERMPYVTSFCGHGDLLSMWRGYAHGPGFAIEFDTSLILDALSPTPSQHGLTDDELVDLRDLNYAIDAAFHAVEYGDGGAREVIETVLGEVETPGASTPADELLDRLMPRLSQIKHPAFAEEQEVRLVVFRTGDFSPQPRLRSANGHLVPYYPIAFPHEAIRSIRVGPSAYRDRSRIALERRLTSTARGEYSHVTVRVSEAPLLY